MSKERNIVRFQTQVYLKIAGSKPNKKDFLEGQQVIGRLGRMMVILETLEQQGFSFQIDGSGIQAFSEVVTPQDIKRLLNERGISDKEFQIRLEYYRCWGIL